MKLNVDLDQETDIYIGSFLTSREKGSRMQLPRINNQSNLTARGLKKKATLMSPKRNGRAVST